MALKVIGVGFGRTGTASLYQALTQLGFPCYHMFEVMDNPKNKSHIDFWLKVANAPPGTQQDWNEVFERYTAAVDNPACVVWRELLAANPDAKIVLTLHPKGAQSWYESSMETVYFTETMWQFDVVRALTPFGRKFGELTRKLIWDRGHEGTMSNRARALAYYEQHVERIKREVPAEKLLIFKATEGWGPLCKHLDVPVPATPFPNVNDRVAFKKITGKIVVGAYVLLGLHALVLLGLGYAAAKLLG